METLLLQTVSRATSKDRKLWSVGFECIRKLHTRRFQEFRRATICSSHSCQEEHNKPSANLKSNVLVNSKVNRRCMTTSMGDSVPEGVLFSLGNPLLDITVNGNKELLNNYELLPNNAIIAEEKHMPLFEKLVKEYEPIYLAGGAAQNTIRIAQWLLQKPKATTFFGGAGKDVYCDILKRKAEEVGVNVQYDIHEEESTGKCAAIITGEDRSLVTSLGAASHFDAKFLDLPENWSLVEKAKCYYIGGFMIPVSPQAVLKVAKHSAENGKTLVMNLHATFLCKHFADPELNLMQYVDVLFGNGDEAAEFSRQMGFGTENIKEISAKTLALPNLNRNRDRIVVFTQGRDPTIVATKNEIQEIPVVPVEKHLIKDTNGCGDSFVGGFLSQLVQGKSLSDCMKCGSYAARVVIQHFGCNYPQTPEF